MKKRTFYRILLCALIAVSLAGCKPAANSGKTESPTPESIPTATTQAVEGKTLKGIINRLGDYLVLLRDDGEYQIMDFGANVSTEGLAEGDKVEVTYTGELNSEDADPVITSITKLS